ncbi:hypothetical protein SIID45300_01743 [Candidatus Magnetaquicoccaceae bacterium FCR-1]|uniref:Uncharacterized protein n=1 Tax=Candidatus Magnetaquiglobus chichijimensis TaxID=3141448 RepID=A0ABQ0C963_9PROT
MSILLAYPSVAAPTAQVMLPDVEQLPASRPVRMRQTALETDSGVVSVYSIGNPAIGVFNLHLYPLTLSQAAAIVSFFRYDIANVGVGGRSKVWQLQDTSGTVYNVRFAQDTLEPMQQTPTTWSVTLTLRQEVS